MHSRIAAAYLTLSLVVTGQLTVTVACPTEPQECTCTYDGEQLNTVQCLNLGFLQQVPVFSPSDNIIQQLEITGQTSFNFIQANAFLNLKIRNLRLTGLSIPQVAGGAFSGLGTHLEALFLDENGLSNIPFNTFAELTTLIYLHLDGNSIEFINATYFDTLVNLKHLYLQGNVLSVIPGDTFRNLRNLVSLYLDKNNIALINVGLFQNMPNLQNLYLGSNRIGQLTEPLLQGLTSLQRLILGRNELSTIPQALLLYNLKLVHLELDFNNISNIPIGLFSSTPNLEYIDISFNKLMSFHSSTFSDLVLLKYLFLRDNMLKSIPSNAFENLNQLQTLDLQNNMIQDLDYQNLIGLSSLKELYLQGNLLTVITYGIFDPLTKLQILDLSRNQLNNVFHGPFDTLRNLERLHLSYNLITSITWDWFQNLNSIKQIYLYNNRISHIDFATFENVHFLQELDISDNKMEDIPENLFQNLSQLQILRLGRNPLRNISELSFVGLGNLKELHLNNTCLAGIHNSSMFKQLKSLQTLYLRHNNFGTIQEGIFDFPGVSLKTLDFYNTNSSSIQYSESFSLLNKLYIGTNPLTCSCENAWLRAMYGIAVDVAKLTCDTGGNALISLVCFSSENCTRNWNQTFQILCESDPSLLNQVPDSSTDYVDEGICQGPVVVDKNVTNLPGVTETTTRSIEEIVIFDLAVKYNSTYTTITWSVTDEYKNYIRNFNIRLTSNGTTHFIQSNVTKNIIPSSQLSSNSNYSICISVVLENARLLPELACSNLYIPTDTPVETLSTTQLIVTTKQVREDKEFPLAVTIAVAVAGGIIIICVFVIIIYCCCAQKRKKPKEKEERVYPENVFKVSSLARNGSVTSEQLVEQTTLTLHPNNEQSNGKVG